jgi:peptidoglycan/xylan/chitin deacetylase (PgdA/CDA1 family)
VNRFVCLMYHNVYREDQLGPGGPFATLGRSVRSYSVTTSQFAEHIAAIGKGRWFDPDVLRKQIGRLNQRPKVLITFDDGWAGSIDEAGPILGAAGARAIVFVTTSLIGHPLFASELMLRELPTSVFEIGAHTATHPFLAECTTEQIQRELQDSKSELEDILGRPVETMSVPNGSLDERVLRIAADCGYSFVFTSETVVNDAADNHGVLGRMAVRSTTRTETIQRWCDGEIQGAGLTRKALQLSRQVLGPDRYRQLRSWLLGEKREDNDMADLIAAHRQQPRELLASMEA